MKLELKSVPNATLEAHDDGTATLTARYEILDRNELVAQAHADSLLAAAELADFVRIDRVDICGMGNHCLMTQRYRRVVPFVRAGWVGSEALADIAGRAEQAVAKLDAASAALEAAGAAVEALAPTPVDPDPAA